MPVLRAKRVRTGVLMAGLLANTACSTLGSVKDTFFGGSTPDTAAARLEGYIGGVAADEPRAALAGREILATGGNAADAAVAVGFMLAVTLPSRAGLGGGGACLVYSAGRAGPGGGSPEVIAFTGPGAVAGSGTDRPAAVPMMPRGLFAVHARYGSKPFETLIAPAEQLARFGAPPSRALLRDLAVVAEPLLRDPNARAVFAPGGVPVSEAAPFQQIDLSVSLSQLRTAGVGDFYQGAMARRMVDASGLAGGGLTLDEMRTALPRTGAPLVVRAGRDSVAFLPPPADGGLAAAAAFQALQNRPNDLQGAQARAMGTAARWRQGGGDPQAVLASGGSGGSLPSLPASTSFVVLDRQGNSVACAVTMNNLFGTGRIAPGTGILLAASPRAVTPPLLSAAIAWNSNINAFRAAVAASGQEGAPLAVAAGLNNALRGVSGLVPEPGRANAAACGRYLPGEESACAIATDPRGGGLAAGSN